MKSHVPALFNNTIFSLSNGTERGNYFFSLGYYKNDGLIKYTNFDRISARINSDYKVIDNILTIGEHFTLNRTIGSPSSREYHE